jgi:hypothetical protein
LQAVGLVKVRPKVLFPSLESIAAQLPDILLKIPLHTRVHSMLTLACPRTRNLRKPMVSLMIPNTGSMVCCLAHSLAAIFPVIFYTGLFQATDIEIPCPMQKKILPRSGSYSSLSAWPLPSPSNLPTRTVPPFLSPTSCLRPQFLQGIVMAALIISPGLGCASHRGVRSPLRETLRRNVQSPSWHV